MVEIYDFKAVEVLDDGTVKHSVYWSLDGEVWGLVSCQSKRDKFSSFGQEWEAAVEGVDEYSHTIAQTWYDSVEDSILGNVVDLEDVPSNLAARIEVVDGNWKESENKAWEAAGMTVAGYLSPTGEPYYRSSRASQ